MNPEQVMRQKLALALGEAIINQIAPETERDLARSEAADLKEKIKKQEVGE